MVLNCGSSSLKYRIISMDKTDEKEVAAGEAQRISSRTSEKSRIIHKENDCTETHIVEMKSHTDAFSEVRKLISRNKDIAPDAFGHRVVHGGGIFGSATLIDKEAIEKLQKINHLAPIHNPPALEIIQRCYKDQPDIPAVGVFDTAFHATIPDYASTYCIPKEIAQKLKIRKYGFHGISHKFVAEEAAKMLGKPFHKFNAVSCHLGTGGASLCAIAKGKSIDNTMGYSPLQGLIMSTRCGDLDAALTLKLLQYSTGNVSDVEKLLNVRSGILGLSGTSSDIRDILAIYQKDSTNPRVRYTLEAYLWRIKKYLGSYMAAVGKPDALIFTDTVGELVPYVRWAVCSNMEYFGIKIDPDKNEKIKSFPEDISYPDSRVKILVIATNEELAIARTTYQLLINNSEMKK
jgi:acetate kinase